MQEDVIFIEGLEVSCVIGCEPQERLHEQILRLNITLHTGSLAKSGQSDKLEDTINYHPLIIKIRDFVSCRAFYLIERVGYEICQLVLSETSVERVSVEVRKSLPCLGLNAVGVRTSMSRMMNL